MNDSTRRSDRWLRNIFAALAIWPATAAVADDVVVIRAGTDGPRRLDGTIVEFNAQSLTLRAPSGRESSIPTSAVIEIKTGWPAEKTDADRSFAERQFASALAQYRAALGHETRLWATRLVQADVVWCLRSMGRTDEACNEFFRLLAMDTTRQYFAAIPLAWSTTKPSATLERRARTWLDHEEPLVRLMGASWLLSIDRGRAVATLEQLASESDPVIAQMAESQLWRTKVPTADDADIARWKEQVSRMPLELRGGPYLALGRVMAYRKQHEQAALALMRVPTLYHKDSQMAAEALLAAAAELEKLGRTDESSSVYRELVNHYETTPQAGQASIRLKAITAESRDE